MKIEEEIYQEKFKDENQKLLINLMYTASWLNIKQTRFFKPFDLTPQQFNVLKILKGQKPKPSNINLFQERMIDKSSNVSRLVDKLCNKGFASRITSKVDRRAVDIFITEKGEKIIEEIEVFLPSEINVFHGISKKDKQYMNELLDRIRETNYNL